MRAWLERMEREQGLDTLEAKSRRGVIVSFAALAIILLVGGIQLMAQSDNTGLVPLLIRLLPIALFLPAVLTRRARGHVWLAFVSLLYLMQGVMLASVPGHGVIGVLEALAALGLFLASMAYARFRSRNLKRQPQS
ncbi:MULTISPECIES: DUF2069 domain-containing protein [Cobetia]|jgi:uncharacterized membrane protein|uniref:DUF2069 domain-containing protein n=1 Tax=Cobetia marina TaxID=28258 RepID=A0ABU9GAQ1_COBMA|nr:MULTISPECIES: DUF2069 domain-containing protein [unclassified Cobetia]MDH2289655.1 DUF2069 domain-containing protein [Cobetia sp. 10Alg 146]MDH2373797.1 DUF2069 domain-containing protein [Cobetia sp. 3AK]